MGLGTSNLRNGILCVGKRDQMGIIRFIVGLAVFPTDCLQKRDFFFKNSLKQDHRSAPKATLEIFHEIAKLP